MNEGRVEQLERSHAVLESKLVNALEQMADISEIQGQMAETLTRLVTIHENNARFFELMDTARLEINDLKNKIATLQEWRSWCLAGIGIVLTAFLLALVGLVIK